MLKFKTYSEAKSIFNDNDSIETYALITEILQNQLDSSEEEKYNSARSIDELLDALSIENLKYLKRELKDVYSKYSNISVSVQDCSRGYSTEIKKFIQNYANTSKPDWYQEVPSYYEDYNGKYPAIVSWHIGSRCNIAKPILPKIRELLSKKQNIDFDKLKKEFDDKVKYYGSEDKYIDILILKYHCPLFRGFKELKSSEEIIKNQPENVLKDAKIFKIGAKNLTKLTKILCPHWYYILKLSDNNDFGKNLEMRFNKRIEILKKVIDEAKKLNTNGNEKQVIGDLDESLSGLVGKKYFGPLANGYGFNDFLRTGEDITGLGKDNVRMLDSFIEKNALKKSMKVYRGFRSLRGFVDTLKHSSPKVDISTEYTEENLKFILQEILKAKPIIHDKGYMSCSGIRSVSKRWGPTGRTCVLFEMNIKQNTPAVYINKIAESSLGAVKYEDEVLIKHGSKFKIINGCIKYHQKQYPYLFLELDFVS